MAIASLSTPQGGLKLVHVVLGAVSLGLVSHYSSISFDTGGRAIFALDTVFFFLLVSFALLLTSFIRLLAFMIEDGESLGKNMFEFLYHLFGFLLYFSASICLFVAVSKMSNIKLALGLPNLFKNSPDFKAMIAAGVFGLVNSVAYLANSFFAFKARS